MQQIKPEHVSEFELIRENLNEIMSSFHSLVKYRLPFSLYEDEARDRNIESRLIKSKRPGLLVGSNFNYEVGRYFVEMDWHSTLVGDKQMSDYGRIKAMDILNGRIPGKRMNFIPWNDESDNQGYIYIYPGKVYTCARYDELKHAILVANSLADLFDDKKCYAARALNQH